MGLATGVLLASQPSINGQLGRSVAHPMQASMISFASGAGIVFLICVAMGSFPPTLQMPVRELPWWIWFGGAIGVVMVTTSLIFVPRVGSLPWFAAVMTGQTVGAIILDHYGWLGNERAPASPMRMLGMALLIAGVMVIVIAKWQEGQPKRPVAAAPNLTPDAQGQNGVAIPDDAMDTGDTRDTGGPVLGIPRSSDDASEK